MHLRLFGSLQIKDGERLLVHTKARALLIYLFLYPNQPHPREKLTDLLWPETTPDQGRRWLSNALYELRQSLGQYMVTEEGAIRLTVPTEWQVDVWMFDQLIRNEDTPSLQQAIELYTGDLAPEIYDDWIIVPRLERRESYLTALETVTERMVVHHQLNEALSYGRRLVRAEPLREHNQQTYLRLLGRLGRRAEALAHYNDLCQLLQTELNIAPLSETQAIAADLRRETYTPLTNSESLPFVGRTTERATFVQQLERLLAGQGGLLAIEGRPGLGKSRLLRELAASARWRNITVLSAPASDRPSESPLQPLQAAFVHLLTGPRRAQLELTLPPETLAACAPLFPAWQTSADLPNLPHTHQRYRLQQALDAILGQITRQMPVLLLLDDWHWADPLAWDYLDVLVQLAPAHGWLLVLAWRRQEMEKRAEWRIVQTWEGEGRLTVLTLQPWTLAEMTSALLPVYHAAAPRLWAISSGNPFLLTEALNALNDGRTPETDVATRAQTLPSEAHMVLECAAVLGRNIPLDLWAAATDTPPDTLVMLGDMLTQRYFLHIAENGYAFAHDLVRATLYAAIPPEIQHHWHGRCAAALSTLTPNQYRARAFHLDRAGQTEAAIALYRQSAAQDLSLGAYAEARAALNRALELWSSQPDQTRAELLLETARLYFITNESEAQPVIDEALNIAEILDDIALQARATLLAGELALKTGRHADAHDFLTQALAHAESATDRALQAEAYHQLGELALREGQVLAAYARHEQELTLARQIGNQILEAAALESLGFASANSGGVIEEVLGYLRQALALRRALGDRFKEAQSLLNLLATLQAVGYLDEVMALSEEALEANETIGYARGAAIVRGTLAQVAMALGQFEEARTLITAVCSYFVQVNDPEASGLYTGAAGVIEERLGNLERAEALLQQAIQVLDSQQSAFYLAFVQMDLGMLYVRNGRYPAAIPLLEKAATTFAANQSPMEYQRCRALWGQVTPQEKIRQMVADECWATFQTASPEGEERQYYLWALWQLLLHTGRPAQAGVVLQAAYATLQQQAHRLQDSVLRQSFFERVPINREIVAAYDQWRHVARHLSMRLVRLATPLGRLLTKADYIEIYWTVNAPEDEAITDPVERRRFVLRRLLAEAASQEAAPTDDDLAQALGVSRRTILRDMQALAVTGTTYLTRKRK